MAQVVRTSASDVSHLSSRISADGVQLPKTQGNKGTRSQKEILLSLHPLVRIKTLPTFGFCKAVTEMISMFGG